MSSPNFYSHFNTICASFGDSQTTFHRDSQSSSHSDPQRKAVISFFSTGPGILGSSLTPFLFFYTPGAWGPAVYNLRSRLLMFLILARVLFSIALHWGCWGIISNTGASSSGLTTGSIAGDAGQGSFWAIMAFYDRLSKVNYTMKFTKIFLTLPGLEGRHY